MKTKDYAIYKNLPYPILSGRWGDYISIGYKNVSESKWEGIKQFTKVEYDAIWNNYKIEEEEREREERRLRRIEKLADRAAQVTICLESVPLEIGGSNKLWESVTPIVGGMRDAYGGCGKITAYINNKKIIAFHYGYEAPDNAPVGAQIIQCEVSGCQILIGYKYYR